MTGIILKTIFGSQILIPAEGLPPSRRRVAVLLETQRKGDSNEEKTVP